MGRVEHTRNMSKEDLSGHLNYDYSHSSIEQSAAKPGAVRGLDDQSTARGVKEKLVITDISADQHGSWINGVHTPNEVHGFPFKVREGN